TAGVFAKENAAVLLGIMALWDLSFGGFSRKRLPALAAVVASLAIFLAARYFVYRDAPWIEWPVVDNPLRAASFVSAKLTAVKVIGMELWLLLCPWRLAYDRSYGEIIPVGLGDADAWIALLVIVVALAVAIALRRRDAAIFFAAGFFGIA